MLPLDYREPADFKEPIDNRYYLELLSKTRGKPKWYQRMAIWVNRQYWRVKSS